MNEIRQADGSIVKEYLLNDPKVIQQIKNQVKSANNPIQSFSNHNLNKLAPISTTNSHINNFDYIKEIKPFKKSTENLSSTKISDQSCIDFINKTNDTFFGDDFELNKSKFINLNNSFTNNHKTDIYKNAHIINTTTEKILDSKFFMEKLKDYSILNSKEKYDRPLKVEKDMKDILNFKSQTFRELSTKQCDEKILEINKNMCRLNSKDKEIHRINKIEDYQNLEQLGVGNLYKNGSRNIKNEKQNLMEKNIEETHDGANLNGDSNLNEYKGTIFQKKFNYELQKNKIDNLVENKTVVKHKPKNLNSLNIHDDAMKNIIITKQQQLGIDLLSVFESYVREVKDQMNH